VSSVLLLTKLALSYCLSNPTVTNISQKSFYSLVLSALKVKCRLERHFCHWLEYGFLFTPWGRFLGGNFKFEGVVLNDIYNFDMKKVLFSIILFLSVAQVWAADTYNPANGSLTIPTVLVGDKLYTNVVVTISGVVAVNGGAQSAYWDTYNTSNGQLSIPAVTAGSTTYTNVVATVGGVVSIGGVVNANPTLSDAGLWLPIPSSDLSITNNGLAVPFAKPIYIQKFNKYGLVVTGWSTPQQPYPNIPGKVNMGLFTPDANGNLKLNTSSLITDSLTNGGGSIVIADFNGDGQDDIFLAAHNEMPFVPMNSTAYISNKNGSFDKLTLSDHNCAHDAELAIISGVKTVITSNICGGPGQDPGDPNPTYQFQNGSFVEAVSSTPGYFMSGNQPITISGQSSAIANFSNDKQYQIVKGDVGAYYNEMLIGVFSFSLPNNASTSFIQKITPFLAQQPQYKNYSSFFGPGLVHTPRLWSDDVNHDGLADVIASESLWSSQGTFPSYLEILTNKGDGNFIQNTNKLNPDMPFYTSEMDYTPTFIDLDQSGINTYLFAGAFDFKDLTRQANYVLLNDGTGRIYIGLHDQFNYFSQLISPFINTNYSNNSNFYNAGWSKKFIPIPQSDGSLNFLAQTSLNVFDPTKGINVNSGYVFINLPLHYNPKTDFTQNITVSDRNNSMLMRTWAGNDVFYDTNANSKPTKIDGGLGLNTTVYSGNKNQYSITRNSDGTTNVVSNSGAPIQVNDTLKNIQIIQFADQSITLN
jgi:hypothetical protein